jgi:hypothetical protein
LKERCLKFQIAVTILLLSSFGVAQSLTGTVTNGTTGRAAAGDEVILLGLGQGMEEVARTKTDAKGNFSFKLDDSQSPHLVRANHQEVTYHRMAPPGTTSLELQVYEAGEKIEGLEVIADVMRVQTGQSQLEVTREFAVQNSSKPPRTQMNVRNLEFYVPEGATIGECSAATEHGNPLKTAPRPEGEKNRYSFFFPLRPGITRFQASYVVPYNGSASIDPRSIYPLQHFVAIVPKSMDFAAVSGANFKSMNDPNQPDANVQVASATTVGQALSFKISGRGTLQARVETGGSQGEAPSAQSGSSSRDGDVSDPLQKYKWYIISGFVSVLLAGAIYAGSRQRAAHRLHTSPEGQKGPLKESDAQYEIVESTSAETSSVPGLHPPTPPTSSSMLMEGLKEEFFLLEVEHKQGKISQLEYQNAKGALEQMLERALKREAVRQSSAMPGSSVQQRKS